MQYPKYPYGETVTVLEATSSTDPFSGEETQGDWSAPTETVVEDCAVAYRTSNETNDEGHVSQVITGLVLYGPYSMPITAQSRIRLANGDVWEVDGKPAFWKNPFTGWEAGCEVNLREVTG